MGLGVAKVDEHAVAEIPRHEPPETSYGFSDAFLIGRDDVAQVLRVHPGRERRRPNKVREHHRDLTTFGGGLARWLYVVDWLRGHWGGRPHIFTDCRENLPPVPEWNTDFPMVLICEMAENGNVNLVLGKALSVLPEAELFEPVRNPLHRTSANFPLASTPAGGSVHILLAKDCSRAGVGAAVVRWSSADIATCPRHVRFGSKADIRGAKRHVRYSPVSGHVQCTRLCPLWANSGHCTIYWITSSGHQQLRRPRHA